MLRHVALEKNDVSEELRASIIRVTRISELGTTLAYLATDARCEEIKSTDDGGAKLLRNFGSYKNHKA
jgi:hypothetical protein